MKRWPVFGSRNFGDCHDRKRQLSGAVRDALRSYDITLLVWTQQDAFRERLED